MIRPHSDSPDSTDRFHPTVAAWFRDQFGSPSPPQREGWPAIAAGEHTLIAAPTGTGKTLTAFLHALNDLLCEGIDAGGELPDETRILYVSPLRALGNDVQKNLQAPLAELRARDPSLPDIRVSVRSGDTTANERAKMARKNPHILVTTPESLFILLTSEGGRRLLAPVRTVIVDEIHAMLGDKRGSHLALSLERLDECVRRGRVEEGEEAEEVDTAPTEGEGAPPPQRIGLSATQKPVTDVADFLVGVDRPCTIVDVGHRRELDVGMEVPDTPLETICSTETWIEISRRVEQLIAEHSTTLIFVGTRKLAEKFSLSLQSLLGEEHVTCHHSSLSKERRLDAETRLKNGKLKALVATASLELGIDIGDVDLVVQLGTTKSIAAFLQRVGRSGHTLRATPKGRLFPLTIDELVEGAGLLRALRQGLLDRTPQPAAPLDILAQQIVAECATGSRDESTLFEQFRRAWPYRELDRPRFDAVLELHAQGRYALLHRDRVHGRVRGTRRARLTAITSGGAIPDRADYRVLLAPGGTFIGTLDEDFAVEATVGDVFQLGSTSWQVLKVDPGILHVGDAKGIPPSLPFWFGEAPARTDEMSEQVSDVRECGEDVEWLIAECGIPREAAEQIAEYLTEGRKALGTIPTRDRVVVERFFDENENQHVVIHSVYGGRVNRAWGLGLRKKFCRNFGFELQAAANEDAFLLSLGPQHSFEIPEIFSYVRAGGLEKALNQAILPLPMFETRWRWNVQRSLQIPRMRGGKKVPPPLQRMRAQDLLSQSFPEVLACGETLPPGDFEVPSALEQPMVSQTIHDCLHEVMDLDGAMGVLSRLEGGELETVTADLPQASPFARSILNAAPYSFLDDAPLEERRTQAVTRRQTLNDRDADSIGALDPDAVARVREEAWPDPQNLEEMHEVLLWIGYVTEEEARRGGARRGATDDDSEISWLPWLESLIDAGRVVFDADERRFRAVEVERDEKALLRGRLDALGPVAPPSGDAGDRMRSLLQQIEGEGSILRVRLDGREQWCERRLLARIQRYTLETLRERIRPVTPLAFVHYLAEWQGVTPETRGSGPQGVLTAIEQLSGFEIPAPQWEREILPARVEGYRREWLDEWTMTGQVMWGRLWGSSAAPPRRTPITLFPRDEALDWLAAAPAIPSELLDEPAEIEVTSEVVEAPPLPWHARQILQYLEERGAAFAEPMQRDLHLLPTHLEEGLASLVAHGLVTNDSFSSLRQLIIPSARRKSRPRRRVPSGRWDRFRVIDDARLDVEDPDRVERFAHVLLRRYGVVFKRLLEKERLPYPWRDLLRVYRRMELRGEARGGRFVGGPLAGEQYALPRAVPLLRKSRNLDRALPELSPRDPVAIAHLLLVERLSEGRVLPRADASGESRA